MKFKLNAGAEFDILTQHELQDTLRNWMVEVVKGARPVRFSAQAQIVNNAVSVGGFDASTATGQLGPRPGFVWAVRRITQTGLAVTTDPTAIWVNNTQPQDLVLPAFTGANSVNGYKSFNSGELLLVGDDRLIIASTGAVASVGTVTIAGAALELPVGMLWKLI